MRHMARARAKSRKNRKSMLYITCFLLVMLSTLLFMSFRLDSQRKELVAQTQNLEHQKQEEMQRTKDIEAFASSTNTRSFIEQTAKEKLGLVYANEILFKKER